MTEEIDKSKLVDLLYDEDLTDEERREAERLLEDEQLRSELSDLQELLETVRENLDTPEVPQKLHDDIVGYAREAADSPQSDDDQNASRGDVVRPTFGTESLGQTVAVAAAVAAVIGAVVYIGTRTAIDSPSAPTASKSLSEDSQGAEKAAIGRKKDDSPSEASEPGPDAATAAKRLADRNERPDTGNMPPDRLADETNEPDTSVGTGTQLADNVKPEPNRTAPAPSVEKSEASAGPADRQRKKSTDDQVKSKNDTNRQRTDEGSSGIPELGNSTRSGVGTGSLQKDSGADLFEGTESSESKGATSRESTKPRAAQPKTSQADKKKAKEKSDATEGTKDKAANIETTVDAMIDADNRGDAKTVLVKANQLLDDARTRDVQVAPGTQPEFSAHYYALEYKLRALTDLQRWQDARTTLAVIRREYPDAPSGRIEPIATQIPSENHSGSDAPASNSTEPKPASQP